MSSAAHELSVCLYIYAVALLVPLDPMVLSVRCCTLGDERKRRKTQARDCHILSVSSPVIRWRDCQIYARERRSQFVEHDPLGQPNCWVNLSPNTPN